MRSFGNGRTLRMRTFEIVQAPSTRSRVLARIYRCITGLVSRLVMHLVFCRVPDWRWRLHLHSGRFSEPERNRGLIWFHAASAGELEMLWSVARRLRELPEFSGTHFGLTVFSPSGKTRIERFRSEFSAIYCGPSPGEGEWAKFFEQIGLRYGTLPFVFVTAKYESWPELWGALVEFRIPLVMVNSEWRRSLRWCSRITRAVFGKLPRSIFFTASQASSREISSFLPGSTCLCSGDPRWDQIISRLERPEPRVQELRERGEDAGLPRPWVVVGSAWDEDLDILLRGALCSSFRGTLWFVPHRPCSEQLRSWVERTSFTGQVWLSKLHQEELARNPALRVLADTPSVRIEMRPKQNAESVSAKETHFVLVQEMGILAELYSVADAAWVGGGFRSGLHSTIEPALSDLRIGAGALRALKFPEVPELIRLGQLELLQSPSDAGAWLTKIMEKPEGSEVLAWQKWRTDTHLGAARRIAHSVAEIVTRPGPV